MKKRETVWRRANGAPTREVEIFKTFEFLGHTFHVVRAEKDGGVDYKTKYAVLHDCGLLTTPIVDSYSTVAEAIAAAIERLNGRSTASVDSAVEKGFREIYRHTEQQLNIRPSDHG